MTTHARSADEVAGWWSGQRYRLVRAEAAWPASPALREEQDVRAKDRRDLWQAFRDAGAAPAATPMPADPAPVVDAAIAFVGRTALSRLALVPAR